MLRWIPLCLVWLLSSSSLVAAEFRLLELDSVDFEYQKLDPSNRDPYAPEFTGLWRERAALRWDLRIAKYMYWNNHVHTETYQPSGMVKTVGWEWETGFRLGDHADIFHYHHSRHVMEEDPENRFPSGNAFPVENAVGIRVHLYKRSGK